jgi:hypothetical protein
VKEAVLRAKTIVVLGVLVVMLAVPGVVHHALAAPIPSYLEIERWGILCVRGNAPGLGPINVLILLTFDPEFNGGIDAAKANELFSQARTRLTLTGGLVTETCAFTPAKIEQDLPNIDALQAAQTLSQQFKQLGFALFFINDTFWFPPASHLDLPDGTLLLRTDLFAVTGPDDATYTGSTETTGEGIF